MPVYEYVCRTCEHAFEELVFGQETPACPACASRDLEKQYSGFATRSESKAAAGAVTSGGPGACGTCGDPRGPGACAPN